MTLTRIPMPSPNYSTRAGSPVRLIVVHTAEGATTIESLGNYFASASVDASSHAGADDKPDTIGVYVRRADKAWTQANANPYSVALELCGFASWSTAEWDAHPVMLANCAAWIAEEAAAFGVPLRRLTAAEAQSGAAGVCEHVDLGPAGGGHWDCGTGFPLDRVVQMAIAGGTPAPAPDEETDMAAPATATDSEGRPWVFYCGPRSELWARCGTDAPFTLGGEVTDAIAVVMGPHLTIDVYAYAPNGQVWSRHAAGYDWSPWFAL